MPDNRLPTNQSQLDIVEKLDEIKDAIVQGGGGGGGTGGHTIIDENGTSMTARSGLQFVGADVSDDGTNDKTIVDLASASGIDGVFIDTDNVIQTSTPITSSADVSYTATEDCAVLFAIASASNNSANVKINDILIWEQYDANGINQFTNFIFVKKGQTIKFHHTYSSAGSYTVYGIQTGTTHSKFQPVIYSTEEREIGVWTDGKPLYQRTFELTIPDGSNAYEHTFTEAAIPNLDKAVATSYSLFGIGERAYVPWYSQATVILDEQLSTGVTFYFGSNNYAGRIIYYTVQYTKTTDVAGSGSWTPQGVPTHHYSTDEQIVGTWNGETLYERMFEVSHTFTQGDNDIELQSNVDFVSSDIKTYDAATVLSNGAVTKRVSQLSDDTLYVNSSNKLVMYFGCTNPSSVGTRTVRVVAQYTKSS